MSNGTSAGGHIFWTNDSQCQQFSASWDYPGANSWTVTYSPGAGSSSGSGSGSGSAIGNGFGDTVTINVTWNFISPSFSRSESVTGTVGYNPPVAPSGSSTLTGSVDQTTGVVSLSWSTTSGATTFAVNCDGIFLKNVTGTSTTDTPTRGGHTYTVTPTAVNACGTSTGTASNALALTYNTAPNAPILITPPANGGVATSNTERFVWSFNDPDTSDSQSAYDIRYRVVSTSTWTTVPTTNTPNNFRDFPGGTFTAGGYEWQVRTYDSVGAQGPFSTSSFFTVAVPPAGPTITSPVSGSTVGAVTVPMTWSAPSQASYQLRTVADFGGAPDATTVYQDTGEVVAVSARTANATFNVNNRYEHVQLRVKVAGIWSAWASNRVHVIYSPPAAPAILLTPDNGSVDLPQRPPTITVTAYHPTPTGSQPVVASMDIYRGVAGTGVTVRIAKNLTPSTAFIDRTPASGVDYAYLIRVFAASGLFADSPLTSSLLHVNPNTFGGFNDAY